MSEENKAIVRRIIEEFWNKADLAVARHCYADNFVCHTTSVPEDLVGPRAMMKYAIAVRAACSGCRITIEDMIAEGDKVATRWIFTGTSRGEWQGIPPTGQPVTFTGISIARFEGGKCVEEWINADDLALLRQLGAVPDLGRARTEAAG